VYQLIRSLPFVLLALNSNNLYSHDGEIHVIEGHSKADMLEQCVEPTEMMQKDHFGFLYHQRDNTVIDGIRTKQHSLANCIDCHVSYDKSGTAIPINSEGQFCQTCHVQTAVNIDCFTCHATVPREKKVKASLKNNINKSHKLESSTNSLVKYFNESN
tara:strand:+ start:107 stop:580 length:474 start_codon:yes stop_codon:yes gene_type:complete